MTFLGIEPARAAARRIQKEIKELQGDLNWNINAARFVDPGTDLGEHFRQRIEWLRARIALLEERLAELGQDDP
ncbi:MAG TPA: hypothetical protein VFA26_07035 [Gemmataceae bacterium]|nr:hypothetical protein [Gemmataceae bacterium]